MALQDCVKDQEGCTRCNVCKWTPFYQVKRTETQNICPSISKYNFHTYSGGGKMNIGLSINEGRTEVTEKVAEVVYKCTLCGACDYTCKIYRPDLDVSANIEELRIACVEAGQTLPEHRTIVESCKNGNSLNKNEDERLNWSEGLDIKQVSSGAVGDVYFHVGCKASFDPKIALRTKKTAKILMDAGVDLITSGMDESCCGGNILQLGFVKEGTEAAVTLLDKLKQSGAKKIVTSCAHCYSAFKYYYPRHGVNMNYEVVHISELFADLIDNGSLELNNSLAMNITYHDPCNLGRKSESYIQPFEGNKRERHISQVRTGEKGVYDQPRHVLTSIKGIKITEMDRTLGYSWCCGASAGVSEANPELTEFAGLNRVKEAGFTGTEAIVTACPWCEESLSDAAQKNGGNIKVYDLVDLVIKSKGGIL